MDQFTWGQIIFWLNHVHGDHCNLVGGTLEPLLWQRSVPAECAEEVAKVFDIPYPAIYPLYPGNTYYFDDFTPESISRRFTITARSGMEGFSASDDRVYYDGSDGFGIPCPCRLGPLGSMHNLELCHQDKTITGSISSSGRDYEEHCRDVREEKPI